jgi:hypothetical protein
MRLKKYMHNIRNGKMPDELLKPYSIYLPQSLINKLKKLSQSRRASAFIRDALITAFNGGDEFTSGYNKGLRDASNVVRETKEASILLIGNDRLSDILVERIDMLEQHGK